MTTPKEQTGAPELLSPLQKLNAFGDRHAKVIILISSILVIVIVGLVAKILYDRTIAERAARDIAEAQTVESLVDLKAKYADSPIGDERWLEDGKPVDAAFRTTGEGLSTPLILEGVEIGDYTLVLAHPELGEHTIRVAGENLENGQDCLVAGSLDQPGSIRLRLP